MTGAMEFGLLGTLVVRSGETEIPVRRGHQRALLAILLLEANRPVPVEAVTDALWGPSPPPSAPVAIRGCVQSLRLALGQPGRERISTQPHGYLIRVNDGELDLDRFEHLMSSARAAARSGCWAEAAGQAREALSCWRGEPLADIESDTLALRHAPRLAELRLQAVETRIDADLRLGGHAEVIAELQHLCVAHPLREHLYALLMLALYRCGRQADALAAYQRARDVLVTELGIEPGPGLRDLHQRILTADPALALTESVRPAEAQPQRITPRELPSAVSGFTGRSAELKALTGLLDRAGQQVPGTVVISAIGGTAGVGKTTLAVHWAHNVAERFPDGQLYVNLRGYDPGQPMLTADALAGFLRSLGVPGQDIPPDQAERAVRYRSLLAGKRILIVLDNAGSADQVRPLLPASPASLVLVTSRSQLSGLAAADGAQLLSLDVLPHDEAVQLLTARVGASRVGAEPEAADAIATLCACLPLALAVAAARAAARPGFPLATLAAELRDASGRLGALDAGDPATSIGAVFSWSYRQLSPDAARMFRLLGLHPGPDIAVPAAASLAAVDEPQARRLLRELARDCLLTEHTPGRYAFHDLLRAYAASQARDHDPQPDRDAATGRLLDHYLHTARHCSLLLKPTREPVALAPPAPGTCPERPAVLRQALAWFEAEYPVLLASITLAGETGADSHVWQLPCAMTEYLSRRSYPWKRAALFGAAQAAATRLHDLRGQAMSLRGLGYACTDAGDYTQARAQLERSLRLYQRLGDGLGEAVAQQHLGVLANAQGRYADALSHVERALRLFQANGHKAGEAEMLDGAAWCHVMLGDCERARAFCEQSLALIAELGGTDFEHAVLDTLGYIELHLGDFTGAAEHLKAAIGLSRDRGDRYSEAETLVHVGDVHHAVGDLPQARQAWQQALAIYDDLQYRGAAKARSRLASANG